MSLAGKVVFVTGGCRSGKSRYAESLCTAVPGPRAYIATAEIFDEEMRERVRLHRAQRGDAFDTIEAPIDLAAALCGVPAGTTVVMVDCLTVWLGNLMHHLSDFDEDCPVIVDFLQALGEVSCQVVLVSNELGMGIVPEHAMSRRFRDVAGRLNQRVAAIADEAYLTVSGLPIKLKGSQ
ncbi:bifunctional adenosylcobinamide kinase/adenosylcobinamide-phosphate guanylyltransferase [Coraliomargarita algicola]|uniref:Adenosylcobinamide kinase n=1 Tax=Coraliomargarita algicola TaxID=3092156 RepID=A0ABZ0RI41_9BACT|nr:bifunctional adenosylcobinamide kinase/adenosylcobinamide-phosphate guanylyltransferase [Coraliomargarita sp. J2-16]WPJ94612.1 bifunctional adenosylcobinamide kinase/adenosylcobinamide-phosphate guanylyltransferase [Coraliomargarita sp. J2-16]